MVLTTIGTVSEDESPCEQLTRENRTLSYYLGYETNCQDGIDNDQDL